MREPSVYAAGEAAFAASSLPRTDIALRDFMGGWNSSINAYVGGPFRGDAWATGRRAGMVYYGVLSPMEAK